MSDGFKTTLAVLGSVILVLFISFCIGMCTQPFRDKVYDVIDVVPEGEYLTISEYNELLNTELATEQDKLLKMTSDKATLQQKILNMESTKLEDDLTIANYQSQVDILTIQIENLTQRIANLQEDMLRISNNVNNAQVSLFGTGYMINYPVYDANNNFLYTTSTNDSCGITYGYYGQDLINQWNNHYGLIENSIVNNLTNTNAFSINLTKLDKYHITIDNCTHEITMYNEAYFFNRNSNFETKVIIDGVEVDNADVLDTLKTNRYYEVVTNLDFTMNETTNSVENCVFEFNVTMVG